MENGGFNFESMKWEPFLRQIEKLKIGTMNNEFEISKIKSS